MGGLKAFLCDEITIMGRGINGITIEKRRRNQEIAV